MTDQPAHAGMNKHTGLKVVLAFITLALLLGVSTSLASPPDLTVNGLRQAGWMQVDKSERDIWYPGKAPYEKLKRQVYEVTYTFKKGSRTMTCTLSREVMYDTSEENCREKK